MRPVKFRFMFVMCGLSCMASITIEGSEVLIVLESEELLLVLYLRLSYLSSIVNRTISQPVT